MKKVTTDKLNYSILLESIKSQVVANQHKAAMAVNSRMLFTYWIVGQHILAEQSKQGWGAKVIDQLAKDLKEAFPKMKGFSSRNLKYMRSFAQEWPSTELVQQAAAQNEKDLDHAKVQQAAAQFGLKFESFQNHPIAQIPWAHHMVLIDKFDDKQERLFYCQKTIEGNWSRKVLMNKIEQGLHDTQGALPNNFTNTLATAQSELAHDTFKDPYFFDFLQLGEEALEQKVEDSLVEQITNFLLELGAGFAYMGKQYKLEVGGQEYFLDLLFFHTKLNCYVVIELKIGEFIPEFVGKVQFYLSAVDELVKTEDQKPSIGLILCKQANKIVAEYALSNSKKPIGIAEYKLGKKLPKQLQGKLPSIKEIENKLSKKEEQDD